MSQYSFIIVDLGHYRLLTLLCRILQQRSEILKIIVFSTVDTHYLQLTMELLSPFETAVEFEPRLKAE